MWPEHVRARIRDTYGYLGASLTLVAGSAIALFRSPQGQRFFAMCERRPILVSCFILLVYLELVYIFSIFRILIMLNNLILFTILKLEF